MKTLRILFIIGWALLIINLFIPDMAVDKGISEKRFKDTYDVMKIILQKGQGAAHVNFVLLCICIAFIILSLTFPKRLIFIIGAIFGTFALLAGIIGLVLREIGMGLLISIVFRFVALILIMTGFFIKPEKKIKVEKRKEIEKEKVADEKEEAPVKEFVCKEEAATLKEEYEEHKKKEDDDFFKY